MDNSGVFSDDEYDLISNPSHRSLGSSVADLPPRLQGKDILEPAPSQGARDRFETTNWSAEEIQTYVRKVLGLATPVSPEGPQRTVRVYVDGPFDIFNVGHVLQLRQAKLSFPLVHLIVGVFSDEVLNQHGCPAVWSEVERVEMVRHCRWVDEVLTDVPWEVSEDLLLQRRLDYIAIDEGTSVDPQCDKLRVKGYDEIKRIGQVIPTRRTKGFPITRLSLTSPPTPVVQTHPMPRIVAQHDEDTETPEPTVDVFGLGY